MTRVALRIFWPCVLLLKAPLAYAHGPHGHDPGVADPSAWTRFLLEEAERKLKKGKKENDSAKGELVDVTLEEDPPKDAPPPPAGPKPAKPPPIKRMKPEMQKKVDRARGTLNDTGRLTGVVEALEGGAEPVQGTEAVSRTQNALNELKRAAAANIDGDKGGHPAEESVDIMQTWTDGRIEGTGVYIGDIHFSLEDVQRRGLQNPGMRLQVIPQEPVNDLLRKIRPPPPDRKRP